MKDKALNIFFKIFIFIFVTVGLALTTVNLFEVPTRFGITSEDSKACEFLLPATTKSCRSQNFAEVRNTVMYLRADIVPQEGQCLAKKEKLPNSFSKIECPTGFVNCYSETIQNEKVNSKENAKENAKDSKKEDTNLNTNEIATENTNANTNANTNTNTNLGAKETQGGQEQHPKIAYYLFDNDCSRLLYFSSAGIPLKNLLKIKETEWSVEQDLLQ